MKLEVYGNEGEEEGTVRLRLVREGARNAVTVEAVGEDGVRVAGGNLLTISEDGVFLYPGLNRELGFIRDGDGRLVLRGH